MTDAEQFKQELEALLAKYPNQRLNVTHTIEVVTLMPPPTEPAVLPPLPKE